MRRSRLMFLVALVVASLAPLATAQTVLYVSNEHSNDVSVVDPATGTVLATLPAMILPTDAVAAPDGSRVYLSHAIGWVSVIDTATNVTTAQIPLGVANPNSKSLALSPSGDLLYVLNANPGLVSVVDTATLLPIATITVGQEPSRAVFTPDGALAFVTNMLAHTVSVIDTQTHTVIGTVVAHGFPHGIATSKDGSSVYVANWLWSSIQVIDVATLTEVQRIDGIAGAFDVGVHPVTGDVWVVRYSQQPGITVLDPSGVTTGTLGLQARQSRVRFSPDGALAFFHDLAGNSDLGNTIHIVDTATQVPLTQVTVGTAPSGIAVVVPQPTDPATKEDCKNGGWAKYGFANQGLCIQFVNTGIDSR